MFNRLRTYITEHPIITVFAITLWTVSFVVCAYLRLKYHPGPFF